MAERHLWQRIQGETFKAYEGFELYRQLGPARSLQVAWEQYFTRPGTRRQRGDREVTRFPGYWARWSTRWRWLERAMAWDEEVAALARDQELDRELKARVAEQEEDRRQRQLMREEARAARAVGRRLLMRLLQEVEAGKLECMGVTELLPHLQKISALVETGQKLDRLYSGEPTDVTRTETTRRAAVAKLVGVMQEFVPEERWGELAEKLDRLEVDD